MKTGFALAVVLVAATVLSVRADIPPFGGGRNPAYDLSDKKPWWKFWQRQEPPRPRPGLLAVRTTPARFPLVLQVEETPRVQIPRQLITQLKSAPSAGNGMAIPGPNALSPAHSILAGIFLTILLTGIGLAVVRRATFLSRPGWLVAGVLLLIAGGAAVWANAPPPFPLVNPTPAPVVAPNREPGKAGDNTVLVEIGEETGAIRISITREQLRKLGSIPQQSKGWVPVNESPANP